MGLPIVVLPAVSAALASRPQFAKSLRVLRAEGVSIITGPHCVSSEDGAEDDAPAEGLFPWHQALDEAYSMTGLGAP